MMIIKKLKPIMLWVAIITGVLIFSKVMCIVWDIPISTDIDDLSFRLVITSTLVLFIYGFFIIGEDT